MNVIEAISSRRSIRQFTSQPISSEDLQTILAAGMSGPSAVNARPWSYQAVNEKSPKTLGFVQSAQKSLLLYRSREP